MTYVLRIKCLKIQKVCLSFVLCVDSDRLCSASIVIVWALRWHYDKNKNQSPAQLVKRSVKVGKSQASYETWPQYQSHRKHTIFQSKNKAGCMTVPSVFVKAFWRRESVGIGVSFWFKYSWERKSEVHCWQNLFLFYHFSSSSSLFVFMPGQVIFKPRHMPFVLPLLCLSFPAP
jgi:hypothetical protein